ncbi:GAK9 protein, partial [Myiagra hebetior]|nr:GAK9 protein [Myiagra hebetior]
MERQAVQDLLRCFLEKRGVQGIDTQKELEALIAYGLTKRCFVDPSTIFEREEWRRLGYKIWEATLDDDKTAKKLGKPWRRVMKALDQHYAEQKAAKAASERLGTPASTIKGGSDNTPQYPLPLSTNTVFVPPQGPTGQGTAVPLPSAPPAPPPPQQEEEFPPQPLSRPFEEPLNHSLEDSSLLLSTDGSKAQRFAAERRRMWQRITEQAVAEGDRDAAGALVQASPVGFSLAEGRGLTASITSLDWKLLKQLCSTVSESGIHGEPARQMLDYIWGSGLLLPADIRIIMCLILTQHQQLLFNAHWQAACPESVAVERQPGDPLHGIKLEELMGSGAYLRVEAQALMGPDKAREAMRLARAALERIKAPGVIPSYVGMKQGREEPFGSFIDRVADAVQSAGVPEYVRGAVLKQCALHNCNAATRRVIFAMPGNWTIEELLERMAQVPVGPQALLVNAIQELGAGLKEQAQATQRQVLAALAALRAPTPKPPGGGQARIRCCRCGHGGHVRKEWNAGSGWCQRCWSDTHVTSASWGGSGNRGASTKGPRVRKQMATPHSAAFPMSAPQLPDQPQAAASAWTWQPQ